LGEYLVKSILHDSKLKNKFSLCFVWNRTFDKIKNEKEIPNECKLENLDDFYKYKANLIVEVSHPNITEKYALDFLKFSDFFCGSPTVMANEEVEKKIRNASKKFGVYIPSGALWGAQDINKMAENNTLLGLKITMKKHPKSLKLEGDLKKKLNVYIEDNKLKDEFILFNGSVRELCPLAPNNVNTMACGALAGFNLGFDKVECSLVADKNLNAHIIEIEITGPSDNNNEDFKVLTHRYNPALIGSITGNATYASFVSSLLRSYGFGPGFHFC